MKNSTLLTLFILALTAFGCAGIRDTAVTPDQIPPDFRNYKDTLLVVDDMVLIGHSKYLRRNFAQYYKGPYKIVSRKEYSKPGNNFRYVFFPSYEYSGAGSDQHKRIYYIMSDSETHKHYETFRTGSFSQLMINYIMELNAQLGKP